MGTWGLLKSAYVCKRLNPYLSELPDDTGRFELPITWTVPHPDVGLSLEYFSTQLGHGVETDLLLRCVFKVLEQKRDVVLWLFALYIQHEIVFLILEFL